MTKHSQEKGTKLSMGKYYKVQKLTKGTNIICTLKELKMYF